MVKKMKHRVTKFVDTVLNATLQKTHMAKITLPTFPPLDPNKDNTEELARRRALLDAAWPDDVEVSDEELVEMGYAVDITNDSEGISVFLGRGRSVKG